MGCALLPGPVLGIVDGISDSGAALFLDGRLVAAVNEERLCRVKLAGGFPALSIAEALRDAGLSPRDLRGVVVAGIATPALATRAFRGLQRRLHSTAGVVLEGRSPLVTLADLVRYRLRIGANRPDSPLGRLEGRGARAVLARELGEAGARAPLSFVEHHAAHAATAFFGSGYARALVITADSMGDGVSLTVSRAEGRRVDRLFSVTPYASFGSFYALVTRWLGFRPSRHEGKVLALSAHGDADRVTVPFPLRWDGRDVRYDGEWGRRAWAWLERLRPYGRADVAAWLQRGLVEGLTGVARDFLARTGLARLAVAGGVFANVALNRALLELPGVESIYVYPHMGDGGLAVGAVLEAARPEGFSMPPLYLGPVPTAAEYACAAGRVRVVRPADPADAVARILAEGGVVARCAGRMEYGPRALGHRSVLAAADRGVTADLNRRLSRDEFMPFAPVLPAEAADDLLHDVARAPDCARHMTLAFRAKPALFREAPGAVHADGTARAQVVSREDDPELHAILVSYARRTGRRAIVNTSFNRHEEPIVCRAEEAAATFRESALDALLLGPYLLRRGRTAARKTARPARLLAGAGV